MRCLCCNGDISGKDSYELEVRWHKKCIKKFWGTKSLPELECNEEDLMELARNTVDKGLTVPGVQKKLSLHLSKESKVNKLTIVGYPTGYILKPQSEDFIALPEAEYICMQLAKIAKIPTVENALYLIDGKYAYVTKRVDRTGDKMYAMEDFCQLSLRQTADKYKGSYESCGKIIAKYSKRVGLDETEFFYRLLFCFVTGNSDMHLKNFSLIEDTPASRIFGLSPAYDLLPVNIIMKADKEETALTLNGKKRNIRKKDFLKLADNLNISDTTAERLMKQMTGYKEAFIEAVDQSYMPDDMKEDFKVLIGDRIKVIEQL